MKKEIVKSSYWNSVFLVLGKVTFLLLSLFSVFFTTRILGPAGYGKLAIFLATIQVFFVFGVSWTLLSVFRYGIEEYSKLRKINSTVWSRLVFLLPTIVISLIFLYFFRNRISSYIKIPNLHIILICFYFLSIVLSSEAQYYLQAIYKIKFYSFLNAIEKALFVIGLVLIFFKVIPQTIPILILVYALSSFLFAMVILGSMFRRYILPFKIDTVLLKKMFLFSFPLIFGAANAYCFNWIDVIIINKFMTIRDVGIYALAYNGISMLQQFSTLTSTITVPLLVSFLAQSRVDLIKKYMTRIVPQAFFIWTVFLTFFIICSKFLIILLGGKQFFQAIIPFSGLLIGLMAAGLASLYSAVYNAYEITKYLVIFGFIDVLVNILLDFLLVPLIGINGAVIATICAYFMYLILIRIAIYKRLVIKRDDNIFLFIVPALIILYTFVIRPSAINYILGGLSFILLNYFLILKLKIFQRIDLSMIEEIDMPIFLRNNYRKIVFFIGRNYKNENNQ